MHFFSFFSFSFCSLCNECRTLIENHDQMNLLSHARNNLNKTFTVRFLVVFRKSPKASMRYLLFWSIYVYPLLSVCAREDVYIHTWEYMPTQGNHWKMRESWCNRLRCPFGVYFHVSRIKLMVLVTFWLWQALSALEQKRRFALAAVSTRMEEASRLRYMIWYY